MPLTNVLNNLCVKISLLRSIPKKYNSMQCGLLPVMHRSDAYSSTSYSRGIRWLPSPEVRRMAYTPLIYQRLNITGILIN